LLFFFFPPWLAADGSRGRGGFLRGEVDVGGGGGGKAGTEPAVRTEGLAEDVVRARQTSFMSFSAKSVQRG
jgi:hypothetical protein